MKKIIYLTLIIFLVALASAELDKQYQIEIVNEQGELKAGKIEVVPMLEEIYLNPSGDYKMELISFDDESLELNYFDLYLTETIRTYGLDGEESYSVKELNKTSKVLLLPYHNNAKEINIYNQDIELKLTIPVAKFSKDVSEEFEEKVIDESEKEEMEEKKNVSKQEKETEQQELKQVEEETKKNPVWKWIMGIIGLLIIIFIIAVILAMRKSKG